MFRKDEYFVLILGLDNAGKTVNIDCYFVFCCFRQVFFFLQTYLEQTKTKFNVDYNMMNPSKITSTVGLNSKKSDWSEKSPLGLNGFLL